MKRVLTAAVLIPPVIWLVIAAPSWAVQLATAIVASLSFYEFHEIANLYSGNVTRWAWLPLGLFLLFSPLPPLLTVLLVLIGALSLGMRSNDFRSSVPATALLFAGLVYVYGAWRCALTVWSEERLLLLYALALNWVVDTGAFVFGKIFGRSRMALRLSPNKTWEGFWGGLFCGAVFGLIFAAWTSVGFSPTRGFLISIVLGAIAQLGDLAESMFKRGVGLKDSGRALPGHGGWLDRTDGLLFTFPAILLLLNLQDLFLSR